MLNRTAAVESASRHLTELVPLDGIPVVEEHYLDNGIWQITLSYAPLRPPGAHGSNGAVVAKDYKTFAVDGKTGEVLSMKIRWPKG